MLKIERTEVVGWDHAIRGMRNPMNSWDKSDSEANNLIITLCGSSKFKNEFEKVQKELSLKGYLVFSLGLFGHSGDDEAWEKIDILKREHMEKIIRSNSIFVIDVDGYIGETTKQEIDYARYHGKKIYYYSHNDLENIKEIKQNEYNMFREIRDDFYIGPNDLDLMRRLRNAGTDHRKFMRFIDVYVDITAPLYWWKEFDTYKVGTVANSCSTMHKIHTKEFTLEDFSCEHLFNDISESHSYSSNIKQNADYKATLELIIDILNNAREWYLETKDKKYWWQMIQLLPSSYNQKRTLKLNYEVLANMYKSRNNHKLDEWHTFCDWIESLPYSEIITGCETEEKSDDLSQMFIKGAEEYMKNMNYTNPFVSFTAPAFEALADLGKSFNGAFDFIFHTDCLDDKNEKE